MSAQYTHDLAVKTGEYQDSNGQTKSRWLNVGKVFEYPDGGKSIKLDALPVLASWDGWINVYPRRNQGQRAAYKGHHDVSGSTESDDSDIPF